VLEIRLLGQFDVRLGGAPVDIPSRPAQSLLAYLLLNPGIAHRRERLAGLLWPDATDANSRGYLRKALWHLRKALPDSASNGRGYWQIDEIAIAFNARAEYWLDTAALEAKAEGGGLEAQMQRAAVYRGELLPGFYDEWAVLERERLQALFEQQMSQLLEGLIAAGLWPAVLEWGERWIALGGAPEPAYRALMAAHGSRGDLASMAAVYQRCVEGLARELGVEPSAQTQAIYAQLRTGGAVAQLAVAAPGRADTADTVEDEAPAPGQPPFKGLQYFEPADSEWFFGREQLTASFVQYLQENTFLAIVGASGSGKSSLVRAGLVPTLAAAPSREADGPVYLLTPGAHPLEALAASLGQPANNAGDLEEDPDALLRRLRTSSARPLFVVDQFEELFTLCRGEAERLAFLHHLLAAATGKHAHVVVALRADFYAHCAQYPDLRAALADHQVYIGPMSAAELRRAIEAPARLGGWVFEPGLVDWLLREAGDEPGVLPLLSHALLETWQRRRGRTLTFQGYAASGGVQGAIAKTAETVFNHTLTPAQQSIGRGIFLRLTELGEGTQDTRRRATLAELIPGPGEAPAVETVLRILADSRLITMAEGTVEVAHEALIREWPALRQWLAEDRDGLRLARRLSDAAQEWEALDYDSGALYRGARLAQALEWTEAHSGELNALERNYLTASEAQARAEEAEMAARQQRELDATRRLAAAEKQRADESGRTAIQLRRRAIYLTGVVVLALLLAAAALWLGDQARRAAAAAQANERVSFARELAAAAVTNLEVDPERSILLALEAVDVNYSVDRTASIEAEEALHGALQASRVEKTLPMPGPAVAAVFSPDGRRLAGASSDGVVIVWDTTTGLPVFSVTPQFGASRLALAFSPDGSRLATSGPNGMAEVWDGNNGQHIFTLAGHEDAVLAVAFSHDGTRLATASLDGTAALWDAATGQRQYSVRGLGGGMVGLALSPEGTRLATAGSEGELNVWEVAAGRPLHLYTSAGASWVAFNLDGARLTSAAGNTVTVWDAWSGQALRTLNLTGHTGEILSAAFSLDGARVATGSLDRRAIVWDVATGQSLLTLAGHTGAVNGTAFSPDGTRLATADADGKVRIWNIGLSRELFSEPMAAGSIGRAAISPDGKYLAAGVGSDGLSEIWDATTGQPVRTLTGSTAVRAVAFDPTGKRLATAGDGGLRVWDTATGAPVFSLQGVAGLTNDVAFRHDGSQLVTAGADGTARTWSGANGQPLLSVTGSAALWAAAFSPDDARLAAAAADGTTRIWDSATGTAVLTLTSTSGVRAIAFSPDGTRLATATEGGVTQIWDTEHGEVGETLSGHTSLVMGVAFRADGIRLATASRDGVAKVWDAATGELLLTLPGSGSGLNGVAFSPDGSRLFTNGDDGLRAYLLRIEDLLTLARTRMTRPFTLSECQQYLHLAACPAR
jgi:WD40 repeat protein/DNA-binding SARP family transcriptional activator